MTGDRRWLVPADTPRLNADEVHVWRVDLDAAESRASANVLREDEWCRAARFHFERDRTRFIAGRAALRRILGAYLDRAPADLIFTTGSHGKPALDNLKLEFNLSHSGGWELVAVSRGRQVGVDIERLRADFASETIARRFFAPAEVAALGALAPEQYSAAFFRCWTRKEAYVKACGDGLALGLDHFEVPLEAGAERAIVSCTDHPLEASRWGLREIVPAPGYLGALVVEGHGWTLRTLEWRANGSRRALV